MDLLTGGHGEHSWIGAHDPTAFRRQQGEFEGSIGRRLYGQPPRCRHIQDSNRAVGLAGAESGAMAWVTVLTDDRDEYQPIAVDGQVPLVTCREKERSLPGRGQVSYPSNVVHPSLSRERPQAIWVLINREVTRE